MAPLASQAKDLRQEAIANIIAHVRVIAPTLDILEQIKAEMVSVAK